MWCENCSVVSDSLRPHGLLHGVLQARILEWVAFPFSMGSSQRRNWIRVSCIAGKFFTSWATGKPKNTGAGSLSLLQGIFPTQESNQGFPHCSRILYQLSYQGGPTWQTWVWASSGSWWWTGRPGVLHSIGSQSQTQLVTELRELRIGEATSCYVWNRPEG